MTKHPQSAGLVTALVAALFVVMLLVLLPPAAAQQPVPAAPPVSAPLGSTRALFTYRRDDGAGVTRIHIDAARVGATPLAPDVFGNFIEHVREVVYEVLWADALFNPDLERNVPVDAGPPGWDLTGTAAWREGGAGYLSPSCVRLSAPDGVLSQGTYLPVGRTRRYTLTLYTRGPGQVTASLRAADNAQGRPLAQALLTSAGDGWQAQTVHWDFAPDAPAVGQRVRLALTHAGGGDVDVDQVSLFPDDAVDGMDPDVIRLARAWDIPLLRMAGNFSSQYHWRQGVGPPLSRPTVHNGAWGGIESNRFGTDEYLELCRLIGATPQIGANAGDGTPAQAAAWVRYCNAQGLRVPVWEIGNELYGGWQIGHTDALGNAARYVAFRDAMLQADPRLRLIATGRGDEFSPEGLTRDRTWNLDLLNAAIANNGQAPDWLSIHPLVPLPGGLGDLPYAQQWESAMAQPYFLDATEIPQIIDEIVSVEGPGARTRIAPTEWGIILGGDNWQAGPNHTVEAACVFNALTLNTFLRHGDWVTLANVTALLHGTCITKDHGVAFVLPGYYTEQLYAQAAPRLPVGTDWSGPGADVPARGRLPAVADVPDVDVFSALTADRRRLVVFAVNRRLDGPRRVTLDVTGFPAGRLSATVLTAPDPQTANTWDHPDAVRPQPFPVPPGGPRTGWTVTLPPHALVVFTLAQPQ